MFSWRLNPTTNGKLSSQILAPQSLQWRPRLKDQVHAPVYGAPEVMREIGIRQTAKVDVYSYGILVCEVTMGQFPLEERLPSMIQAIRDKWMFMHGLITACIQEHPDNRPAMSHVLTELNKF